MFGDVGLNIAHTDFEEALANVKKEKGATLDVDLTADDLKEVVKEYKKIYEKHQKSMACFQPAFPCFDFRSLSCFYRALVWISRTIRTRGIYHFVFWATFYNKFISQPIRLSYLY